MRDTTVECTLRAAPKSSMLWISSITNHSDRMKTTGNQPLQPSLRSYYDGTTLVIRSLYSSQSESESDIRVRFRVRITIRFRVRIRSEKKRVPAVTGWPHESARSDRISLACSSTDSCTSDRAQEPEYEGSTSTHTGGI